jgi:hypothetical protein
VGEGQATGLSRLSVHFRVLTEKASLKAHCTVKKRLPFSRPQPGGHNPTLLNYSRPGKDWQVTSRLGTGKWLAFLQCSVLRNFVQTVTKVAFYM